MSRSIRTHRRASLLATSSFVAASVLASVGAVGITAFPSVAMATSECGTAPGILVCNPAHSSYPTGITYTGADPSKGATTLQLNESQVTQSNADQNGVTLTATTGVNLAVLFVLQNKTDTGANVAGNGTGDGILVSSNGGDVSVGTVDLFLGDGTSDDKANTIAGTEGIRTVTTGAGKTTITLGADTVTGTQDAVFASSAGSGTMTFSALKGATITGNGFDRDVALQSANGNVSFNSDGAETNGGVEAATGGSATVNATVGVDGTVVNNRNVFGPDNDAGLNTIADAGLTTLTNNGSISGTQDGRGISADSGIGGITINTSATSTTSSTNQTGIALSGTGGAITGKILGTVTGDYAMTSTQTGTGTINLTYGGKITGTNGGLSQSTQLGANTAALTGTAVVKSTGGSLPAVNLTSTSGTITYTSDATTDIEQAGTGGGISANTGGAGNISIVSKGTVGGTATVGGVGINAVIAGGGTGNASITSGIVNSTGVGDQILNNGTGSSTVIVNGALKSTNDAGVNVQANGGGAATVTDNSTINALGAGIEAGGTGAGLVDVDATNGGAITSTASDGIDASNSGSGGVTVTTGTGATIAAFNDGIVATESGAAGNILVTQNGDIGTVGGPAVGASGIIAQNTKAGSTGNVTVVSNGNIIFNGQNTGTADGIFASTVGNGNVTITATSSKTVDFPSNGRNALHAVAVNGAINVTENDNLTAVTGINTSVTGSGVTTVLMTGGSITAVGGNGIISTTTGNGQVNVGTATTRITGPITALSADGITASGSGNVDVFTGVSTIQGSTTTGDGISAVVNLTGKTTTTAAVLVDAAGSTISGGTGILAQNKGIAGGNSVTVNTDTATTVTSFAGDGIEALAAVGPIFVTNNGAINATGGDGIDAVVHNALGVGPGNVDVNGSGAITVNAAAGSGAGIFVRSDLGGLTVGDKNGGYTGAIDNKDDGNGIDAQITTAASVAGISVTTGKGGTIGVGVGDNTNNGIIATTVGLGGVSVSAGDNIGSLTNNRVNGDGIDAEINNAANINNLSVTTGGAVSIASVGDGVHASTTGLGNVLVTQNSGTGTINSSTGVGINAIDSAGKGTGTVTVVTDGGVTTLANTAVVATSNTNGDVTVDQSATGIINATGGNGIDASETGGKNGNVIVDVNGSTTATGIGIHATTNTNDDVTVTLENGSSVLGGNAGAANDGVLATDTSGLDGQVTVNLLGNAHIGTGTGVGKAAGGNGVEVTSNGQGAIAVNTDAGTNIWSTGTGILANETYAGAGHSADLVITAHGTINAGATGINAEVTSATNNAAVNVTAANITSVNDGVDATTIGGGNVNVTTDAGSAIVSTTGDGINASSTGGNGNVEVINNGAVSGDPGIVVTAVGTGTATEIANNSVTGTHDAVQISSVDGLLTVQVNNAGTVISSTTDGDGIDATTSGKGSISISTGAGTKVEGGTTGITTDGIFAKVGGSGTIGIEVAGDVGTLNPTQAFGIVAEGKGGLVTITLDPTGSVSDGGIDATNTTTAPGNGNINIALNGSSTVNSTFGDAIDAAVDNGAINIQGAAGTDITATGAGGFDGIAALATGSGTITVNDQGAVSATFDAVSAATNTGAISITTGSGAITGADDGIVTTIAAGPASTTITTGSGLVTGTTGFGINASTAGTGNLTLTTGPVTGATGISTSTNGAGVTNITTTGTVTGTGLDGIDATDNAGSGSITITTAAVSAVAGTDIKATSTGGGSIVVTTNGALTGAAGVSASTNGAGSVNVHDKSTVTATAGLGVSAVAGTGGSTVTTDGLVKGVGGILASSTGAGSTQVTVNGGVDGTTGAGGTGVNASSATGNVTVAANGGAADTITGTAGVSTSTGGAGVTTITTTGLVTGTTADGIDAVTTGSGLITIDTGAVTAALGTGIKANSTTGAANITIDTTGPVNGLAGISATNSVGAGSINITTLAVTSTGGVGINAQAGTGGAIVTANGPITSTGGTAINAFAAGAGSVQVITGKAGAVVSTNGAGIEAASTTGPVTVTTNNTVTAHTTGITAITGGAGTINVDTTGGGLVSGVVGDGIDAVAGSGQILIQTAAVTGGGNGISAFGVTAPITIDTNGAITGGSSSDGIKAVTAGAGTIQLNVLTGAVSAGTGIFTAQTGTGVTNIVDNQAANTITGTNGDGIQSVNGAGTGSVNVGGGPGSRIEAAVSGATNGIDISGAGPMNVFTDANVTGGAGWGIKAVSTAAPVTVNVTTGTIQGTSTGGVGGGIFAKSGSAAANAVTVTSTTTVIGLGAGSNGIDAEDTTTGNVAVVDTGPSVTGANDAIFASSTGGTVTVGTAAAPITSTIGDGTTSNAGIQTVNTTGTTTIVTAATAAINDPNALYGIEASSTTGGIAITNNGAIGTAGGGVNQAGIIAQSTGNNTTGITVTNNANIFVDNVSSIGLLSGVFGANVSAGIAVGNEGTGEIDVTNTGNIDPPGVGILMLTNGSIKVNNSGNINAVIDGMFLESFAGGNITVASTGATINATLDDGIDATSVGGDGTITVGTTAQPITSNITAGVNGIHANGGGVVGVVTSGTITGSTGTGIIATSESGANANATVSVTTSGAISDASGIFAQSTGTNAGDTVTVTVGANVTATNGIGVQAEGVNGLTSVALNTGNVNATNGDGINASSSGSGGVTVTTALGTNIESQSAGKNNITATTTGASGDINVTVNGTLNDSGEAGNDAIFAQVNNAASTSNINVTLGSNNESWATNDGVEATTNGLGAVTVADNGLFVFSLGNGIVATATNAADTKNVTVTAGGEILAFGVGGADIIATTAGTGNVVVTVANGTALFENSGAAGSGIIATNSGTAGTVTVTTGNGTIGETGELIGTDGINAQITNAANGGAVTVTNASTISMADGSDAGIKAISAGAGTVTVTNSGVIDPAAFGIYAKSGGNVVVNDSASITALTGIHAQSTGASSTVSVFQTNPLATITAKNGNGIEASTSGTGTVSVGTSASRIQGDVTAVPPSVLTTTDGIVATGNGSVQVWTGTGTITGGSTLTSWGIKAASGAGALAGAATTVNTEGHVTAAGGILASNTGTLGTDTVSVTTTGTGAGPVVNGALGDGVQAVSNAGAITVTSSVTNGTAIGTAVQGHTNGIDAASTGGGAITVTTSGNITGVVGFGIGAATSGGSGSVGVTTNDQAGLLPAGTLNTVSGQTFGITASSAGTGSTTVTNNTLVTATGTGTAAVPSALNGGSGPVGIEAVGGTGGGLLGKATGVTVNANANVTAAGGRGIVTSSQNNALITIASGVTVKGLGDATTAFGGPAADTKTHAVVDVSSVSGAVTTIANNGTIESVNGPAVSSYGDLAITAATTGPASKTNTGGVTITNSATGTILGRLELQGETASDNVIVNNAGVWHTTGKNAIGATAANAETITNTGFIGTADNSTATLLAFGTGVNTVTNAGSGVIVLGESPLGGVISGTPATPAITTITGTVTFNNNGTIIMGNAGGSKSASDGLIDSTLEATGTTLGGTGVIDLDANLWSDIQSAAGCATSTLTAADCLVIGGSTGTETIKVTDTKAHTLGAFNPTGIVIVDGSSAAATFALNSGSTWFNPGGTNQFGGATNVLDKPGLFFYDLAYNGADKTERLIGVPKAAAFEFATVGGAANDLWYTTTQTWFDRQADLRDGIDGKAVGSGPGVWLKMIGDWSQRDHNDVYTDFNKTYVFNVTYDQDTAAIIGGIDLLNVTHKNEAWVVGIDGGSVDSSINFRASPDRFHLSGANVGGYATYMNGGLYIDGTINANLLNMQASLPQLQTTPNPWTASDHVQSFGGQVEAGYSMPLGDMLFWEPLGIVSYANTTLGPLAVPGGVQKLGDDDSFRASLGARVGATADFQYYKVKLTLTGRVWDEFSNDTLSTLVVPGGPNFLNNDNLKGVFGEISGQVNLFTLGSGLSAFATGGVKFKSSYTEGTMTLGARYQF